jgi:hypothetical protein
MEIEVILGGEKEMHEESHRREVRVCKRSSWC